MALRKQITAPSGHINEYWRIISIQTNYATGTGRVTLAGYKDEAARLAGLAPSTDAQMVFEGYTGHGGTAEVYAWIRERPSIVPAHYEMQELVVPVPQEDGGEPEMVSTMTQMLVPERPGAPLFADAEDC
jgi:hypothetical protein